MKNKLKDLKFYYLQSRIITKRDFDEKENRIVDRLLLERGTSLQNAVKRAFLFGNCISALSRTQELSYIERNILYVEDEVYEQLCKDVGLPRQLPNSDEDYIPIMNGEGKVAINFRSVIHQEKDDIEWSEYKAEQAKKNVIGL